MSTSKELTQTNSKKHSFTIAEVVTYLIQFLLKAVHKMSL